MCTAALAEHARNRPGLGPFVDVRPAHVERLAAPGAEQKEQLHRARDDEPRDLFAVFEDGIASAGDDRVEGVPKRLDFLVGENAFAGPLRTEALQTRRRIALDQFLAQAPAEGRTNQCEDAVGSDGRFAGDAFEEGAELAAANCCAGCCPIGEP
jgi:hypothetical protein